MSEYLFKMSMVLVGFCVFLPNSNAAIINADITDVALINPTSPGVYGVELRGGRAGARDWEIGVGTQTSNRGTFNQGEFSWNSTLGSPFSFLLDWDTTRLSVTVGGITLSYNADWVFGNALVITTKGRDTRSAAGGASFYIDTIDGVSVNQTFGSSGNFFNEAVLTGIEFTDGFTISGTVDIVNGGGSRNEVLLKPGNVATVSEPPLILLLGLSLMMAVVARRRRA